MNDRKYGIFVHGLHKSASMFLFKVFQDLANEAQIEHYSANNKPEPNQQELNFDTNSSFCYCPVRHFAISPSEISSKTEKWSDLDFIVRDDFPNLDNIYRIYQLRDPRDILVSQYFSFGFIHSGKKNLTPMKLKIQKMTIDEYCLEYADELYDRYCNILKIIDRQNPNYLIVHYETMVLNFREWLAQVIEPFEFNKPKELVLEIYYQKHCQEFETEGFQESMKHKRKMIPGDHSEKLTSVTIETLNNKFADILHAAYTDKELEVARA
jgi:hypothetical protein